MAQFRNSSSQRKALGGTTKNEDQKTNYAKYADEIRFIFAWLAYFLILICFTVIKIRIKYYDYERTKVS